MKSFLRNLLVSAIVAIGITACGGASGDLQVNTITIDTQQVVLRQSGESKQLGYVARDANGKVANPNVQWASSSPDVSVTPDGLVTARVDVGSALITVKAGNIVSNPVLITVARVRQGVRFIDGTDILNTRTTARGSGLITLRKTPQTTAISTNNIILTNSGRPLLVRALSVQDLGDRLELTANEEQSAAAYERLNYRTEASFGALSPSGAVLSAQTVNVNGSTIEAQGISSGISCVRADGGGLKLFEFTAVDLKVDLSDSRFIFEQRQGWFNLPDMIKIGGIVNAKSEISLGSLKIEPSLVGKFDCYLPFAKAPIAAVPTPIGIVISGDQEFGLHFPIELKVGLAGEIKISGPKVVISQKAEGGLQWNAPTTIAPYNNSEPPRVTEFKWFDIQGSLTGVTFEGEVGLGLYTKSFISIRAALFEVVSVDFLQVDSGLKLKTRIAPFNFWNSNSVSSNQSSIEALFGFKGEIKSSAANEFTRVVREKTGGFVNMPIPGALNLFNLEVVILSTPKPERPEVISGSYDTRVNTPVKLRANVAFSGTPPPPFNLIPLPEPRVEFLWGDKSLGSGTKSSFGYEFEWTPTQADIGSRPIRVTAWLLGFIPIYSLNSLTPLNVSQSGLPAISVTASINLPSPWKVALVYTPGSSSLSVVGSPVSISGGSFSLPLASPPGSPVTLVPISSPQSGVTASPLNTNWSVPLTLRLLAFNDTNSNNRPDSGEQVAFLVDPANTFRDGSSQGQGQLNLVYADRAYSLSGTGSTTNGAPVDWVVNAQQGWSRLVFALSSSGTRVQVSASGTLGGLSLQLGLTGIVQRVSESEQGLVSLSLEP